MRAARRFARLDDAIVKLSYDKSQIGSTIYLKLVSFNLWSGGAQQLADVTPYAHVITGPPRPPNVTGFTAAAIGRGGRFRLGCGERRRAQGL